MQTCLKLEFNLFPYVEILISTIEIYLQGRKLRFLIKKDLKLKKYVFSSYLWVMKFLQFVFTGAFDVFKRALITIYAHTLTHTCYLFVYFSVYL